MKYPETQRNRMKRPPLTGGFTMVEILISIGILSLAILAIASTIVLSSTRSAEDSHKLQAANIIETAMVDLGGAVRAERATSALLNLPNPGQVEPPQEEVLFFNSQGVRVDEVTGAFFRYRLVYHDDPGIPALTHVHNRISWPATAAPDRAMGSVEMIRSFSQP